MFVPLDLQAEVPLEYLFHMQTKDNIQVLHASHTWMYDVGIKQTKPAETVKDQLIFICMDFIYKN